MTQHNESFVFAAMAGDLPLVKTRLNQCNDINYVHPKRGTALFQAAIGGHNNIVDYLIGLGANPNLSCPQWGCNAVDAIARQVNYKPVTMIKLIKSGGRPDALETMPSPYLIVNDYSLSWYGLDHSLDTIGAWFDLERRTFIQYTKIELSGVGEIIKLENAGLDYVITLPDNEKLTIDAEENPGLLSNGQTTLGKVHVEAINLLYNDSEKLPAQQDD